MFDVRLVTMCLRALNMAQKSFFTYKKNQGKQKRKEKKHEDGGSRMAPNRKISNFMQCSML